MTLEERVNETESVDLVCHLNLRIEAESGRSVPVEFRVDTGSTRSLMPLALAVTYGLPVPDETQNRTIRWHRAFGGSSVVQVRTGHLRVWWNSNRQGNPFDWPVTFIVDAPAGAQPLFGLGGVIQDCRWVFDGQSDDDAAYGTATFHDIRT